MADFDLLTLAELHEADLRAAADGTSRRALRPHRTKPRSIRAGLRRILRLPVHTPAEFTAWLRRLAIRGQLGPRADLEINRHVAWI
jgi:hypothetical protein